MKNNMFMALATTILNAIALLFTPLISDTQSQQAVQALCGLISPFLSIYILRLYIAADDPPELIRKEAALKKSIKACRKHLKEKDASENFKKITRKQMELFQTQLQKLRSDYEEGRIHEITPFTEDKE